VARKFSPTAFVLVIINSKSLLHLLSLVLLSVAGLCAQSLQGLTIALSVECPQTGLARAFSTALTKQLKNSHDLAVGGDNQPADILVRLSIIDLNPGGEISGAWCSRTHLFPQIQLVAA